jgi:hypothetical protein
MHLSTRSTLISAFSLAICLLAPAASRAEDSSDPPAGAKELRYFVGSWTGKGEVKLGGRTSKATATYQCREVALGWGVACDLEVKGVAGFPRYVLTSIWGFDAASSTYHWYAVTNGGEVHDHAGKLSADKKTVTLEHRGEQDGKAFVEKIVLRCENQHKFNIDVASTLGSKPVENSRFSFTR